MIEIKNIQGNVILSVPITQSCQRVEELMVSDYIQLSWNSNSFEELPIGCYIEYRGEKYSLLEPYVPTQKDEVEYVYTPQFKSKIMKWAKMPFFFYSEYNGVVSKEPDWTLTSNPADFMKCVCDAIKRETGETWTYSIDASLPASTSLSFSTIDILSGLNEIANAFETEWYADKATNTLYLGKAEYGSAVTLKVGENIKVPTTNNSKEGYYTRFYAFGSTRNIAQDYKGANVNNLVNKRLTLDPIKYPNGYKDIKDGLQDGEIFSKVLIFDDVYPSADLSISSVRPRLMYRLDESGNKIQLGTDENGNPIYDQYAIWYFRIEGFDFDVSNILEGYKLSVSFESGSLAGREFELKYYENDETITTSDGITFEAKKGDYEILFIEEGDYIIPSLTGLVPNDGDSIVLFNIKMPSEYTQSAYDKLEEELNKEIERSLSDLNNYSFKSNPVAFEEDNTNLSIGRKVTYVNGDYSYTTRVIKLTTQLDFPIEQDITIGNEKVKGNTQQLKEEVATANKDLNLLAVFNDMTQSLQQSYARTQQMMLDGFASIKNIWQLRTDKDGRTYAFSAYDLVSKYGLTMYGDDGNVDIPQLAEGLPFDQRTIWFNPETEQIEVIGGTGGGGEGGVSNFWDLSGIPSWITNTKPKYSYSEIEGTPDLSVFVTGTALNKTLADYATLTYLTGELKKYVTIKDDQDIAGVKNFVNGLKIGGMPITKMQDDVIYIDANLVVRGGVTMYAENEVNIPSILDSLPIASNTALGIASFDSTYFSVDSNGMVSLTSAPSSGASSLGELLNVDASIDATASVDRILYQPKGSSVWTWRDLPKDGVVGNYLPLSGGTLTGDLIFQNSNVNINSNRLLMSSENSYGKSSWRIYAYGPTIQFKETSNADWCLKLNYDNSINVNNIITSEETDGRYSELYSGGIRCYGTTSGGYTVGVRLYDNNGTFKQTIINAYGDGSKFNYIFIGGEYNKPWIKIDASANMLVKGGITMYSDIRKKTKLQDVELSLSQIANAPLIQHYYNSDQDKTTHVGSIAQYWAEINDWFCKKDNEGFYTMEIQNCALASAISIARHLEKYETKTDKTIRKMKQRIQELEDKLEKLEGGNYGNHSR